MVTLVHNRFRRGFLPQAHSDSPLQLHSTQLWLVCCQRLRLHCDASNPLHCRAAESEPPLDAGLATADGRSRGDTSAATATVLSPLQLTVDEQQALLTSAAALGDSAKLAALLGAARVAPQASSVPLSPKSAPGSPSADAEDDGLNEYSPSWRRQQHHLFVITTAGVHICSKRCLPFALHTQTFMPFSSHEPITNCAAF